MEEFISLTFEGKETKRGVDYPKGLIKLTLNSKIKNDVYQILLSLCELPPNTTFFVLPQVVGTNPKGLTSRCLYGKYFHAIVCHSSIMFRIMSGKSANTEQVGRVFNTLKTITLTRAIITLIMFY